MTRNEFCLVAFRAAGALSEELLNASIIVPVLLLQLGASMGSIGILNSFLAIAWMTQILGAWYVEGSSRKAKPVLILSAVASLSFLLVALVLCLSPALTSPLAVPAVIACVAIRTISMALANPAVLDLSFSLIDEQQRVRSFAWRNFVADLFGVLAALIVLLVLKYAGFPAAYVLLSILAAVAATLAGVAIMFLVEEPVARMPRRQNLLVFLRSSLEMLIPGSGGIQESGFRKYILIRHVVLMSRGAFPFAAAYAVTSIDMDVSLVGGFIFAAGIGRVVMSALLNLISRRISGAHIVMQLGLLLALGSIISLVAVPHPVTAFISFFLQGCFMACMLTADPILMLTYSPPDRKVRGPSLAMLACHPASIVWGLVSALIVEQSGFGVLSAIAAAFSVLGLIFAIPLRGRPKEAL